MEIHSTREGPGSSTSEPFVRPARAEDERAVAELLYATAAGMYDRFAGDRQTALRILMRSYRTPGTNASMEVIDVAEIGGEVAAALASFPVEEGPRRARRFLRIALMLAPPWRWPGALRIYRLGGRAAPRPPLGALYVDALATAAPFRRRGAARALLARADDRARRRRLARVALETELDNSVAQALYERTGYRATDRRGPMAELPGFVAYVKELGGRR
jgi:ribosomal protein S18 acetylase RimI-like enzyme